MAVRENYDSAGIHTGLEIGESFSNLEMQLIANRKAVFKKAMAADSFKTEVYKQFRAYNQANEESINKTLTGVLGLINAELTQSYEVGTNTVDRVMEAYKKQGYTPPKQPEGKSKMLGFQTLLTATMTAFIGIAQTARQSANNQLISIANLVDPEADDLAGEIDKVQAIYLLKGIAGSENIAGVEKNMSSQAEFITRNQSHQALLTAEGERSKEYGNPLVQISAHPSSCPLCTPWQGAILINDVDAGGKPDGKHELLSEAIAAGLFHYNCRHNFISYVEGLTRPDLFEHDKASPKETATRYAIEQEQRYNERMIREYKRRAEGAMSEDARKQAESKVKEWQAQQRGLAKIAEEKGVPYYRQYSREQIGSETKPTIPEIRTKYIEKLTKDFESAKIIPKGLDITPKATTHFLDRMVDRKIDSTRIIEGVKEVLENPQYIGSIEYNKRGEPAMIYQNSDLRLAVNPDNGNVVTVIRKSNKYKR